MDLEKRRPLPPSSGASTPPNEGSKPSGKQRTVKTPLQKEVLEASYLLNPFPSEEHRRTLGDRIGLSESQVQVWFTNRRRKDKKVQGNPEPTLLPISPAPAPKVSALTSPPSGGANYTTPQPRGNRVPSTGGRGPSNHTPGAAVGWRGAGAGPAVHDVSTAPATEDMEDSYDFEPPSSSRGPSIHLSARPPSFQPQSVSRYPEPEDDYMDSMDAPYAPSTVAKAGGSMYTQPNGFASRSEAGDVDEEVGEDEDEEDEETEDESPPDLGVVPRGVSSAEEYKILLERAKLSLPVPFRPDGPPLSFDFDDVYVEDAQPEIGKRKRIVMDDFIAEADGEGITGVRKRRMQDNMAHSGKIMNAEAYENCRVMEYEMEERKRREEEKRLKKESERTSIMQKKLENTMKKEQERLRRELMKQQERLERDKLREEEDKKREAERIERERRKQLEKMERDRHKEEMRRVKEVEKLRQAQEREIRKMEMRREKEKKAEERRKQAEEKRREKEVQKALAMQEKAVTRLRQREALSGPPDDLEVEWEKLVEAARAAGYGSDTEGVEGTPPRIVRPEFPPPSLKLQAAFPLELGDELGGELLVCWNFLHSFSDVLGLPDFTVDELLGSLVEGQHSPLLGALCISMIRLLQADMEEAHVAGAMPGGIGVPVDKAVLSNSQLLEEAWAWGFDVDVWRAHLNGLTWPEILRQVAIVWGAGHKRPKARRESKPKMGVEGEDIIEDESGSLKLKLPSRLAPGTVKGAAWQVLSEAGPSGLSIAEIARRIQRSGLRDLRTSKTPEASVAGALSRDVIFARVAPATYALQAVVSYHRKLLSSGSHKEAAEKSKVSSPGKESTARTEGAGDRSTPGASASPTRVSGIVVEDEKGDGNGGVVDGTGGSIVENSENREGCVEVLPAEHQAPDRGENQEHHNIEEDSYSDEDDSDDEAVEEQVQEGLPWVLALAECEFDTLSLPDRLSALWWLVHATNDTPTIRNKLEARVEESQRIRKELWEDAKAEKRKRQMEAQAKAAAAAEEATRRLEELQRSGQWSTSMTNEQKLQAMARVAAGDNNRMNLEEFMMNHSALLSYDPDVAARMAIEVAAQRAQRTEMEDDLAADNQRRLSRAEAIRKVEEANAIRVEPLGMDRRYNRYWRFTKYCGVEDGARIWVESSTDGTWRLVQHPHQLDELKAALDTRGVREMALYNALLRHEASLKKGMPCPSVSMPEATESLSAEEQAAVVKRQQVWWSLVVPQASYIIDGRDEDLVVSLEYPEDEPAVLTKMRQDLLRIESCLAAAGVLAEDFDHYSWIEDVQRQATSCAELRASFAELEKSLDATHLSPWYVKEPPLVKGAWLPVGREVANAVPGANGECQQLAEDQKEEEEEVNDAPLAWLPATVASLYLKVLAFDSAINYEKGGIPREYLVGYRYVHRPAPRESTPPTDDSKALAGRFSSLFNARGPRQMCRVVFGPPLVAGGRVRIMPLPAYPDSSNTGVFCEFGFPLEHYRHTVESAEAAGQLRVLNIPSFAARGGKGGGKLKGTGRSASGRGSTPLTDFNGPFHGGRAGHSRSRAGSRGPGSKTATKSKKSKLAREFEQSDDDEGDGFEEDDDDYGGFYGSMYTPMSEDLGLSVGLSEHVGFHDDEGVDGGEEEGGDISSDPGGGGGGRRSVPRGISGYGYDEDDAGGESDYDDT